MSDQEKKDKKFSLIMSVGIHGSIIALLLFLVAWRPPDPPLPEYGIELNFGFEEAGSGDIERQNQAQIEETENETPPDAEVETEEPEEQQMEEVVEEQPEESKPQEEAIPEVTKEAVKEPAKEEVKSEVTQKESDVKIEEKKVEKPVEKKEEPKPKVEEKKEVTKPVEEKKEEVKTEEKKEEPKPKPKPTVDNRALMGGGKKTDTQSDQNASNNQGKEVDKRGNMGDPKGKTTANGALPGGADIGVSLSLEGWKWNRPPAEKDDSQIDGVIKFRIEVDDRGTVVNVTKIPGTTISDNTIIEFYKKQVEKLSFSQTNPSKLAAPLSQGEITFVIKTN